MKTFTYLEAVRYEPGNISSGIYVYKLSSENYTESKFLFY